MKINLHSVAFAACTFVAMLSSGSALAQHSAATQAVSFQAVPIKCINGFQKGAFAKAPNGMVTKMVCKSPVISCPENTAPGITTETVPEIKHLGGADKTSKFRFVYTCKYYKVVE